MITIEIIIYRVTKHKVKKNAHIDLGYVHI